MGKENYITILKSYKGLQIIKVDIPINGGCYGVRYPKERKAKSGLSLEEAIDLFYKCIK